MVLAVENAVRLGVVIQTESKEINIVITSLLEYFFEGGVGDVVQALLPPYHGSASF